MIKRLTNDQNRMNIKELSNEVKKMNATLQTATENKPAANDLNLKSKRKEHLEIKKNEEEKRSKEMN